MRRKKQSELVNEVLNGRRFLIVLSNIKELSSKLTAYYASHPWSVDDERLEQVTQALATLEWLEYEYLPSQSTITKGA